MTVTGQTSPPRHLSAASKKWWRAVLDSYDLEPHHLKLLEAAATAWDRMVEARALVDAEGLVVHDRWGQAKAHPAVNIERDARIAFARLVRELDLEGEPQSDVRPPRRRGG